MRHVANCYTQLLTCLVMMMMQVIMLERLLAQRDAVCHALTSSSSSTHHWVKNLSDDQWTVVAQLMSTLRSFVEATQLMSLTSYPPLSLIVPAVDGLRRALTELTGGHGELRDALLRLVDENLSDVFDNDELCAATVVGSSMICCCVGHRTVSLQK